MIVDKLTGGSKESNKNTALTNPEGKGFKILSSLFGDRGEATSSNAHTFEDVYACINVLSDDIAKLPVKTLKRVDKKTKSISHNKNRVAYLLAKRPNPDMTPSVYKKLIMTHVLTHGNHYSLMKFDKDGQVEGIYPLDPSVTRVVKAELPDGAVDFGYQSNIDGENKFFYREEVLHIKGYTTDGLVGKSPIDVVKDSIESNHTAVQYNKEMVGKGGTPEGILKVQSQINKESKENVKNEWKRVNGTDAIAVIDAGMEYQQMGISQKDMQFLESQKYNQQKIAAIFKVPLHKINNLEHATFSNIEHQSLDYVKNTIQPWIVQIEEEFNTKLFLEEQQEEGYYIKFNIDSELRGDALSRARVEELHLRNSTKTINEIRAQNDLSPFEENWADTPLVTLNYTFIDYLLEYQNARYGVNKDSGDNQEDQERALRYLLESEETDIETIRSELEQYLNRPKLKGGDTND